MIYSWIKVVTPGRQGTTYTFVKSPDDLSIFTGTSSTSAKSIDLGEVDGVQYVYLPSNYPIPEQPKEINFTKVENPSNTLLAKLREQPYAQSLKLKAQEEIATKIGSSYDVLDMLLELCEFAVVAVCSILADRSGDAPLSKEDIAAYGKRGSAVLGAIQSGALQIRGESLDPIEMITNIIPKYTLLQEIYRTEYLTPMRNVGLVK